MASRSGNDSRAHREKFPPKDNTTDELLLLYCMVAKPVTRKIWDQIPAACIAVDAEWAKLRAADRGLGTWDETQVRSFCVVKKVAQAKMAESGVHSLFGFLFTFVLRSTMSSRRKSANAKAMSSLEHTRSEMDSFSKPSSQTRVLAPLS